VDLRVEHLPGNIDRAIPIGRWDVAGAADIDLRLSVLAGSGRSIILDMTQVSFLSSMGMRSVIICAQAVMQRHAKMVMLSPSEHVASALAMAAIDTLVPIHDDIDAAIAAVRGAGNAP
jgi:anti-anti-sigma factor